MQLTEILSELISFKSITPKDGGSLKFLSDLLKKKILHVQILTLEIRKTILLLPINLPP